MVFFTCQHCGSSLKKNAVEKHYMTECRNRNPNLTCVDCLKDFLGDAYVAHTSCLTEDEKYSAKGFKSKPPSDKGAKKQVSWMSSIQEIKIPPSMSAFQKKVINRCQNSPNVPQKRLKFQNFCKSLFGKFADINQVDEVFDLFEKVHKKSVDDSNIANSASNANSSGESKGTNDTKCQMNGESVGEGVKTQNSETNADEDGDVKMENGIEGSNKGQKLSKKERKELKRKEKLAAKLNEKSDQDNMELESSDVLENCENENTENEINNESPTKNDSSMDEDAQCNGEVEETDKHLSKKEKKKLKKQERFQAQLNEIEQTQKNDDMENGEVLDDKTHKKKKRRAEVNGVFENGKENKKSKKRSREDCGMDIDEEQVVKKSKDNDTHGHRCSPMMEPRVPKRSSAHENGNLDAAETNSNGKSQFDWGDIIVQVLQSRKDKELPIKRLAKKVITEYQTNYATYETFEKISAKFHKKLKKIPGVKVLHDKAKLVVADE